MVYAMATIFGDVQYSQNGTGKPTPDVGDLFTQFYTHDWGGYGTVELIWPDGMIKLLYLLLITHSDVYIYISNCTNIVCIYI